MPVSAQTFQAVKELEKTGKLSVFAEALKNIPSDEFDEVCNSEVFLSKEADEYFTNYNLPYNLRVDLASNLEPTVFYHIAKEFHKFPIEEATRHLIKYSGMDYVKAILKKHFFDRSDIIRCSKVASEFHDLLEEILNNKLYKLRREVDNKLTYLNIIRNSLANKNVKQDFTNFVNDNICSIDDYTDYVKEIKELIKQTESLQQLFSITDIKCEALILLEEKQSSFSPKELEELEMLFGKKYSEKSMPTDGKYLFTRQLYWRGRKDVIYDPEVKRIVEHAIYVYENLNPQ